MCGLGNCKNVFFNAEVKAHGIEAYPATVALIHRLRKAGVRVGLMSSGKNTAMILDVAGLSDLFEVRVDGVEAGRRGGFALVIGVDRLGQAEALREHGADVVVADLSEVAFEG